MRHNDDGVGTRPVCSIELVTTFFAVFKGYWFFVLAWTETGRLTSLDLLRLDCRHDGGSCPNSAGFPRGFEAVSPRGNYRATGGLVWSSLDCLTIMVNVVESSHGR